MPHLPSLPANATLVDVYKRSPAVAAATLALNDAIMRNSTVFSAAECEAIAAYVSKLNACQYCLGVHTGAAVNLGMDTDDVHAICERPEMPNNPRLAPVLSYVAKLTVDPARIDSGDVQRVLDAGWDDAAVSHAAFIAALYCFMNRIVDGHGIRGSEEQLAAGGKRLAEIGYSGLAKLLAGHPA